MIKFMLVLALCLNSFNVFAQEAQIESTPQVTTSFLPENIEEKVASWTIQDVENLKNEGFDFNAKDSAGNAPLYYALSRNPNIDVIKKIIEYGADVNEPSQNGILPINVVTSKANELQLQIMMMKTLGLNMKDAKVEETLEKNVFLEMDRMFQLAQTLIEAGADINKLSPLGTPLMNAVTNAWNINIIELLVKSGADLNKTDQNGRTALFYAYSSGNDDIVTALIKSGADINIKDKDGLTYLEIEKPNFE